MYRSNVHVGRGCKPRNVTPATVRRDYRFATPAQSAAYRQSLIDKGIIGKPAALCAA